MKYLILIICLIAFVSCKKTRCYKCDYNSWAYADFNSREFKDTVRTTTMCDATEESIHEAVTELNKHPEITPDGDSIYRDMKCY